MPKGNDTRNHPNRKVGRGDVFRMTPEMEKALYLHSIGGTPIDTSSEMYQEHFGPQKDED